MAPDLEKREKKEVSTTSAEQLTESGIAFSPDVDIQANEDEVVFAIDLPGVGKGDVKIEVDENDVLSIRAKNSHKEPEGAVLRQYNIGNYYRAFSLSNDLDKEKVSGKIENGLLEIRIPRKEEAKPKKIEINA